MLKATFNITAPVLPFLPAREACSRRIRRAAQMTTIMKLA